MLYTEGGSIVLLTIVVLVSIVAIILYTSYKHNKNRCTQCNKETCDLVKQTVHYSHRKVDGSYNPNGGFKVEMLCKQCRENGFERI